MIVQCAKSFVRRTLDSWGRFAVGAILYTVRRRCTYPPRAQPGIVDSYVVGPGFTITNCTARGKNETYNKGQRKKKKRGLRHTTRGATKLDTLLIQCYLSFSSSNKYYPKKITAHKKSVHLTSRCPCVDRASMLSDVRSRVLVAIRTLGQRCP